MFFIIRKFILVPIVCGVLCQMATVSEAWSQTAPKDSLHVSYEVEKYQLSNGLTVLLQPDRSAPIVSYQTWFRVGSKHERPGITGIAHLFEHMMFKGAKRYDGKQFDAVLDAVGGTNNAFTTRDYTGYYITLPSHKLELAIDLESDRMENLRVTEENLKSEREVVKEERRFRVDNSVMGTLYEAIFANLYKTHSYRWPVIGWMEDLNKITLEDCKAFYKTYYSPNNATIVVSGDFDKGQVKGLIEKYYGKIPRQEIPPYKEVTEAPFAGRDLQLRKEIEGNHVVLSYRAPKADSRDNYAMDLIANVLGEGPSSRLHKRLVLKAQIATSASSWNMSMQDSSVLGIYVALKPGADPSQAVQIVMAELWNLRNKPVAALELEKARTQIIKGHVDSMKKIEGKANALASNEILFGNYQRLFDDLKTYEALTAEEVKKVASTFLNPGQRLLIQMSSKGNAPATTPVAAPVVTAPAAPATSPAPSATPNSGAPQ